ncbi:TIR domain-containing protein [Mycolicibacterium frederiksbergense]|uniref:TIR domain-containing protein n=1 Tax=Mycolicibacterium frederiksbergense TaxID=117567 RepID=UPI00265BB7C0|nr:TIR domain-containing protein [Mycolicibacterium frederiksbergense]MDO0975169.1 TIR domain-containing protein [Mycolicibacterium frederiksbergense]
MSEPYRVEDVFKISGIPTHTYVTPSNDTKLKVALRTAGRGVVVEGPSGIGKSTAVTRALQELGIRADVSSLSARRPSDLELIRALPEVGNIGTVIVDDFHRLPPADQAMLADYLKVLADTEDPNNKLVVVGINQAGLGLIQFATDIVNRIDRIRFEQEPDHKILELISKGEAALNVSLSATESIVNGSHGSFYVAQLLCHEICVQQQITEGQQELTVVDTSYPSARRQVLERQRSRFEEPLISFARGNKFRPSGRAPYYHILKWLAESTDWTINLDEEARKHKIQEISVRQVIDQDYVSRLFETAAISEILHYNPINHTLSIEDPQLMYYLRNIDWQRFTDEVGFTNLKQQKPYDVALSFAGEDREFADFLRNHLEEHDLSVFYDKSEERKIMANDVEAVLGPKYSDDSRFVVAILGEKYGMKKWTLFESEKYRHRIEKHEVIPIVSTKVPDNAFDPLAKKGGRRFDPEGDLEAQARDIAAAIANTLSESLYAGK